MEKEFYRDPADFGDGVDDQLEPLKSLDVKTVEDFDQMLRKMAKTSFTVAARAAVTLHSPTARCRPWQRAQSAVTKVSVLVTSCITLLT